jgi:HD-like signal output (HDOD) protein
LASDPDAEVSDLSDLIHQDQALAANVLRFANTAAYNTGEVIMSLKQAIMRLGVAMVSGIAVAACMESDAFKTPGYDACRRRLMTHALISGGFARIIAKMKRLDVEVMFLCALLHTVGRPVVLRLISELDGGAGARLTDEQVNALLREFDHLAATDVTIAWNLPDYVQVAAIYHQDPKQAPGYLVETRMTALAGKLASWVNSDDPEHDEQSVRDWPEWEADEFDDSEVDDLIDRGGELKQSAASMFA